MNCGSAIGLCTAAGVVCGWVGLVHMGCLWESGVESGQQWRRGGRGIAAHA
jgi:hypothetical protein